MKTFLLRGGENKRREFIRNFIQKNSIPSYNIYEFENKLTIKEVRELKRTISYSLEKNIHRLVIFPLEVTLDAQHALLKTLEEPPSQTYFILQEEKGQNRHIPTVISRSFIVNLEQDYTEKNQENQDKILNLTSHLFSKTVEPEKKKSYIFSLGEKIETREDLEGFLNAVHSLILSDNNQLDKRQMTSFTQIFFEYYSLIDQNNVGRRGLVEYVLLKTLKEERENSSV